MNWKKLLLIAVVAGGVAFAAAPRAEAGLSVGIGIGVPAYGYGYGYGGYGGRYGYGRAAYNPYGYGYSGYGNSRYSYYRPGRVGVRRHYHWRHGRRFFCTERHRRWR